MSRKQIKYKKQATNSDELRFVAYMRKSTEDKNHQMNSISDQQTWITQEARRLGIKVVATFQEEKSASKPKNRPEFAKMMKMLNQGKANAIICYHVDRLSRNPPDSGELQWYVSEGIIQKIHASDGDYTGGDNSNFMLALQNCLATDYVQKLKGRVHYTMMENNRRGRCNGRAAQGYLNAHDMNNLKHAIVIKDTSIVGKNGESRYDLIRKALKMFGTGNYSPVEIKQMLDEWGYTMRRTNKGITLGGLHYILESPFYAGYTEDPEDPDVWHKAEWEPMISEQEYWRNQKIKQSYGRKTKHHCPRPKISARAYKFQLKGVITCSSCGCGIGAGYHPKIMADGSTKIYVHYACNNNGHNSLRKCQLHGGISEPALFAQVDALLNKYRISRTLYEWALEILGKLKDEEIYERHSIEMSQNASIERLKAKRDKLLDMWLEHEEDGIEMTAEEYNARRQKLDSAITELEQSKRDVIERNQNWYEIIGKTLETLNDPHEKFTEGSCSGERRSILQSIGPRAYLVECFDRYSKKGKVLTKRVLEVEPYPWLEKLRKSAQKMEHDFGKVFTANQQGQNDQKSAPYKLWCPRLDSN